MDHEAKAREILNQQRCRNCGTIGDACECESDGGIRSAYPISGEFLVSAISAALREERERAAMVAENFSEQLAMDGELYIGYLIAAAIRSTTDE